MSEDKLKEINKEKLPWFYRLILKLPLVYLVENASGVFWSIVAPIFLILEFFLSMALLLFFPFPTNIILTAIIPVVVFLIFVRISLERFINLWNLIVGKSGFKWDIEKIMQEYIALLKEKEKENG
jgi:hypothetical protein